jgi:hypothetical protein
MTELPKTAHRTQAQKVAGYLNAAHAALDVAARLADEDMASRIERVAHQITALQERMT